MKKVDWEEISVLYKGLWIALNKDEKSVASSGKDAKKVFEEAQKKGVKVPILYKVPMFSTQT
jgi:hypothetical protein